MALVSCLVKTKILQLTAVVTMALFAVSCTTAPYYSASQNYAYTDQDDYTSAPYSAPAPQSQLHPNAVPLIATGIAALALYGYSKERNERKKYQKRAHHDDYYHGGHHDRGHRGSPNRYNCY